MFYSCFTHITMNQPSPHPSSLVRPAGSGRVGQAGYLAAGELIETNHT